MPPEGQNSGAGFEVSKSSQVTSAQNVYFTDADSPWAYHVSSELDSTYQLGSTSDASLGDFLSRPLLIASYQWTPSAQLFQTFNPWELYFANTQVLAKMNHFRNFRCSMCLKIMLNGNSFYYGRAILSYNPYFVNDDVTRDRAFFEQDIVGASQKPHVLLDPCSSQGAEMCLPFVYPENWFDITVANWEASMGKCVIHDFDVLNHANGGNDPITVNIFAWCENVELCIPTTNTAQGGDFQVELDEFGYPVSPVYQEQAKGGPKKNRPKRKMNNTSGDSGMSSGGGNNGGGSEFKRDGMISKPATAIANAANALSMIPMIAPYAKATSMVATKVGQIARLFGYSRPQVVTDIQPYVPRFTGNITNTDSPEVVQKLSVDTKNELTIDSRVTGMDGSDELTIHSIASRESYLTQFAWPETAAQDTFLFSIQVDPMLLRNLSAAPVNEIHQTALGFASTPFSYWQGSIKFRFQIVCSEYHRGRLRIVFDPNQIFSTDFNLTYSTVIDITEDRDFEYEVKWVKPRAWQSIRTLSDATSAGLFTDTVPLDPSETNSNGALNVYVLNELATPSMSAADVTVLVWVSAGDDYAVAMPRSWSGLNSTSYFQEQGNWVSNVKNPPNAPRLDPQIAPRDPPPPDFVVVDPKWGHTHPDDRVWYGADGEVYDAQATDQMVSAHDESNAPSHPGEVPNMGAPSIPQDNQYLVYQGERIVSFRDLLRRYHYHTSLMVDSDVATKTGIKSYVLPNFPKYRGWDPNGSEAGTDSLAGVSPYNFCAQTLVNYLAPAFVTRRGSMRWKYVYNGPTAGGNAAATVARWDVPTLPLVGWDNLSDATGANNGGQKRLLLQNQLTGSGAQVMPLNNNPVFEVELPFYTNGQRFVPARDIQYNTGRPHYAHTVAATADDTTTNGLSRFDAYVATGEDFNLSFFVGAPVIFTYPDPSAAGV